MSAPGAALVGWAGARTSAALPGWGRGLAGRHCHGRPHVAAWLGRYAVSLAQGALSNHGAGAHPAAPAGLSHWRTLDTGGRARLAQRRALRPEAPGHHILEHSAAAE